MPFSRNCSLLLPGIRVLLGDFRCNLLVIFPLGSLPFLPAWGRKVRRSSFSEDFWRSSACGMEHSGVQSQGSISSISRSNQPFDPSGSTSHPSEFVNHGLLLWIQTRQQWLENKRSEKRAQLREPISLNAIYESLHGKNKPFPQPVPLPDMVDFLVDVWEQEGLYN